MPKRSLLTQPNSSFSLNTGAVNTLPHTANTALEEQPPLQGCGLVFAERTPTPSHASAAITFQNSIEINSLTTRAIKRSAYYKVRIPADTPGWFFQQCQQSRKQTKLKPNDIKRKTLNFHTLIMGLLIWLMKQLLG